MTSRKAVLAPTRPFLALFMALAMLGGCEGSPAPAWAFNLEDERLANIVWRVEGGSKTRHPYGVLSVKVNGVAEARAAVLRSITNHKLRHAKHRCGLNFLECWAARWIPESVDPVGHRNWLKNVRYFLDQSS